MSTQCGPACAAFSSPWERGSPVSWAGSSQVNTHLGQDGDPEGLVGGLSHQVQGQDWEDVPRGGADLPANQLLPQPEAVWELFRLPEGKGR